jgi:hypothetical protein
MFQLLFDPALDRPTKLAIVPTLNVAVLAVVVFPMITCPSDLKPHLRCSRFNPVRNEFAFWTIPVLSKE